MEDPDELLDIDGVSRAKRTSARRFIAAVGGVILVLAATSCGNGNSSVSTAPSPSSSVPSLFTVDTTFSPSAGSTLSSGSTFSITLNFPRHTDVIAAWVCVALIRDDNSASMLGCTGGDARLNSDGEAVKGSITFNGLIPPVGVFFAPGHTFVTLSTIAAFSDRVDYTKGVSPLVGRENGDQAEVLWNSASWRRDVSLNWALR